jgi:DNA repair protein RecN (Recombination protein N)
MLACKVVLGEADHTETLVFDEVDAGVGGATAVSLAQVLARLAKTHQVIVVTHLAQVAVVADRHYLVSKTGGEVPQTTIRRIGGEERVAEVARMLSGDQSEESLAHARQMLESAAEEG